MSRLILVPTQLTYLMSLPYFLKQFHLFFLPLQALKRTRGKKKTYLKYAFVEDRRFQIWIFKPTFDHSSLHSHRKRIKFYIKNDYIPGLKSTIAFKYAYSYPSRQSFTILLQNSCSLKMCSITSFPLSVGSLSELTHTQNTKTPKSTGMQKCSYVGILKTFTT